MVKTSSALFTATVGIAIAALTIKLATKRRQGLNLKQKQFTDTLKIPEEVNFLDEDCYKVITIICDTFLPSLSPDECSASNVTAALQEMHPLLTKDSEIIFSKISSFTSTHMSYLQRGAIELNIHEVSCQALQKLTTKVEQQQLYLIIKLLSTSLGMFMLCGEPVAFHDMALTKRIQILASFRDSSLVPLRAFYQTMKRLTCNLFFSYVDHGEKNPSWESIQYDPFETVSKPQQDKTSVPEKRQLDKEQIDKLLREKVTYQSVRSELQSKGHLIEEEEESDTLEADVVVIGSGSGGGMIASELANAGLRVIVLEKGGYYRSTDFKKWRECEAMLHTFEKGGLCTSNGGSVLVLAGSCVGGGSSINWSASFRTPEWVQEDWANHQGLKAFEKGGTFDHSLDEVHRLMSVNVDNSYRCEGENGKFAMNENNRLLWKGAENIGYIPEKIPRNVKNCVDCGHCCYGCPYESKQSTLTALLEPKLLQMHASNEAKSSKENDQGRYDLHIIPHCYVHKIIYANEGGTTFGAQEEYACGKKAVGVEATVKMHKKSLSGLSVKDRLQYLHDTMFVPSHPEVVTRKIKVRAKIIVSAGGSLHTPALLLRSGLKGQYGKGGNGLVGANLTLHPVLGVGGLFDESTVTGLNSGVSMGVVIRNPPIYAGGSVGDAPSEHESYDDDYYYRVAPETPPLHAGLMGLMFPWNSGGLGLKLGMLGWRNSATFIGISRDRSCAANCITIDGEGNPVINYEVTKADASMLMAGIEANLRMMRAAGAKFLYVAHENFHWHSTGEDSNSEEESKRFESYIDSIRKESVKPISMQVFSAHQMSSCRMAASPLDGPVSPSGELYECKNLFVADGSLLPTSLGINPMIVIESLAHMVSKNVVRRIISMDIGVQNKVNAFTETQKMKRSDW